MREFRLRLGKALIVFSIFLMIIGFFFFLTDKKYIIIWPDDTKNISDINISTVSGQKPFESEETNVPDIQNNVVDDPYSMSIDQFRTNLEKKYSIKIMYGLETKNYSVGGYSTLPITDQTEQYNTLAALQKVLFLYPENLFKEVSDFGLPLNIYLIKSFSASNITGITEKKTDEIIISLAIDHSFVDSFNHEVYHYMEHYINAKGGKYANWKNYNPTDFVYGNVSGKFSYSKTFAEDAFFVNDYAQSYEYEDRASTFEYMMAENKISPLNKGKHIWKKAKVMSDTIDYYFESVNSYTTEYWERFVVE